MATNHLLTHGQISRADAQILLDALEDDTAELARILGVKEAKLVAFLGGS